MKVCSKCKIEKDESEFYKRKSGTLINPCKICKNERSAKHYKDNKEQTRMRHKKWYTTHKGDVKRKHKEWRMTNRKLARSYTKKWKTKNREQVARVGRQRRRTSILFAIRGRIRCRINKILKTLFNTGKCKSTTIIFGCTPTELLTHLNITSVVQLAGMHLDHICPLACAKTEEEVYSLNHYSNLRLLSAEENLAKSDRWTPEGAMLHLILLNREWPEPK